MERRKTLTLIGGGLLAAANVDLARTAKPASPGGSHPSAPGGSRRTTGSLAQEADFRAAPQVVEPELLQRSEFARVRGEVPVRVVLANLPPVRDQGGIFACEAHAFGYGLGGYTAAHHRDGSVAHDVQSPENQPSRAWLFKRAQRTDRAISCKAGSFPLGYLEQLVAFGAPSEAEQPYRDSCAYITKLDTTTNALQEKFADSAARLRIGSWKAIALRDTHKKQQLARLRRFIANGHVVAFSGPVGTDYGTDGGGPKLRGGVYYADGGFNEADKHGQIIVGYDDGIGDASNPGAFLVQNSWGESWPAAGGSPLLQGRIWYSYDAFFAAQQCAAIAFAPRRGKQRGTILKASVEGAPTATVSDAQIAASMIVLVAHEFSEPVRLESLVLVPPAGAHVTTKYGSQYMNGYSYFERSAAFKPGTYEIEFRTNVHGRSITYSGAIRIHA